MPRVLVPGGTVLLLGGNRRSADGGLDILREIDLAGDTLRETNINAVNAQLAALGQPSITDFNHDARRLPNGDTAVLASTSKTINLRGRRVRTRATWSSSLTRTSSVAWTWNPFNWLNVRRLPTLGERPSNWTHANSIAWSPADGNLVMSLRSQDWVIKIDYANGTGDGHVIWRLGQGGDFRINSAALSPWFSHQHDVHYINDTTLVLFDNGNTRQRRNPGARSRGQELILDEKARMATLVVNADLGTFAPYTGGRRCCPAGTSPSTPRSSSRRSRWVLMAGGFMCRRWT